MPISDELAALRARGTVKATSTALSSQASTFTTPQQQEALRKDAEKRQQAARKDAEMYLRKHNAGGLDEFWLKKLRELKARKKRAGGVAGWKKKEANDDGTELEEEEEDGLEVEMLPDHLVKALKAKYETENAKEALDRALEEEKEGKATVLSDVMASFEEEDGDEKTSEDEDAGEKVEEENPAGEVANEESGDNSDAQVLESAEQSEHADDKEEEPVEEVRSKIEQLSIEDAESTPVEVQEAEDDNSNRLVNEQSGGDAAVATEESQITDDTAENETKILYNTQSEQFISITDGKVQSKVLLQYLNQQNLMNARETTDSTTTSESNEFIDLADPRQREKLGAEQKAHAKERILAMKEELQKLIADWWSIMWVERNRR